MELLFWLCSATFLYTFIGYPIILRLLTRNKKSTHLKDCPPSELPKISVVLCIYNSASKLEKRINNILESNYPIEKIKVIVISDGSTDSPRQVVESVNSKNITFVEYKENKGKSYALKQALKCVDSELVAFADIRQSFNADALVNMSKHFSNEKIGAVSGNLHIIEDESNTESDPGLYWKYEKWIREKESILNSMLGVTGAIYMARTELIPNLPEDTLLDDMYIPMSMVPKGFKIKFESKAIAYDSSSASTAEEFHRKVRTLAGNFQLISKLPWLISPTKNPLFLQFFSHKVLRLIMPYSLLIMIVSCYLINTPFYNSLFILQIAFYSYSLVSYLFLRNGKSLPLGSICTSFCSLHLASLVAGWKYTFYSPEKLWKKH